MNDEFEKWWAEQLPGLEMCETACKSLARDAWEAGRKDYKGGAYIACSPIFRGLLTISPRPDHATPATDRKTKNMTFIQWRNSHFAAPETLTPGDNRNMRAAWDAAQAEVWATAAAYKEAGERAETSRNVYYDDLRTVANILQRYVEKSE